MKKYPAIIITCEHASAYVPAEFTSLFLREKNVLDTHRAWDPGALEAATIWSNYKKAPLFSGKITRLICDLNRSMNNRTLWSPWTANLSTPQKQAILSRWYTPYRQAVEHAVAELASQKKTILHISVHSFTPVLNGHVRKLDLGILYDPSRTSERCLAHEVCRLLKTNTKDIPYTASETPGNESWPLRVRRNAPYRGISDSFTCFFRKQYSDEQYMGFEIEFNQALLQNGPFPTIQVAAAFDAALRQVHLTPPPSC